MNARQIDDAKAGATAGGPRVKGQVALVTGGGSGIGFATASTLLEAGAVVTIEGRNLRRLTEARHKLLEPGSAVDRLHTVAGDVNVVRPGRIQVQRQRLPEEIAAGFLDAFPLASLGGVGDIAVPMHLQTGGLR